MLAGGRDLREYISFFKADSSTYLSLKKIPIHYGLGSLDSRDKGGGREYFFFYICFSDVICWAKKVSTLSLYRSCATEGKMLE